MEYLLVWGLMALILVVLGACGLLARKDGSPWVGG